MSDYFGHQGGPIIISNHEMLSLQSTLYSHVCKRYKDKINSKSNNCIVEYIINYKGERNIITLVANKIKACRDTTENKSPKDIKVVANNLFLESINKDGTQKRSRTDGGGVNIVLNHKWTIDIDGEDSIDTCRHCIEWTYNLGSGTFDVVSANYRCNGVESSTFQQVDKSEVSNLSSASHLDKDAKKEFISNIPQEFIAGKSGNKITLTEEGDEILNIATLENSNFSFYAWFKQYCKDYGDNNPDKANRTIRLTAPSQLAVYCEYRDAFDVENSTAKPISLKEFYTAWNTSFSHVKINQFTGILGKCEDCAVIERHCLKKGDSFDNRRHATVLHAYHRGGYYGSSRAKYYSMIEEGRLNQSTMICLDVDIMDQAYFHFPFLGTQASMANTIDSGIIGVLEHHYGPHLYHFYDTIHKSSNLVCHVILDIIEKWKERNNGKYPTKIFLNIDGGGENANHVVLALLEHLVSKRIALEINYFRNPPGHTHGPLDGRFGNIKRAIRARGFIGTLDDLKNVLETEGLFMGTVSVTNLTAIMDYAAYFKPLTDPKFARMHKTELTQLVWWFQAVDVCDLFPSGVKVLYRAHAADQIIELKDREGSNPQTELSSKTGVDVLCTFVEWKPLARDQPYRNCDGMYILSKHPSQCNPEPVLKPLPFPDNFDPKNFKSVMSTISGYFKRDEDQCIISWWFKFFESAPKTKNVIDFCQRFLVPSPLPQAFCEEFIVERIAQTNFTWRNVELSAVNAEALVRADYLQFALNSVEWQFDSHQLWGQHYRPPRHTIFRNDRIRELHTDFKNWINGLQLEFKKAEVSSLYERQCLMSNQNATSYAFKNINTVTRLSLERHGHFYASFLTTFMDDDMVAAYTDIVQATSGSGTAISRYTRDNCQKQVLQSHIKEFIGGQQQTLSADIMNIFMDLFQLRDLKIKDAFKDPKTKEHCLKVFGSAKFCSCSFYSNMVRRNFIDCGFEVGAIQNFTKLFIPCRHDYSSGKFDWSLIVALLDDLNVTITHINPMDGLSEDAIATKEVNDVTNLSDTSLKVVYTYLKSVQPNFKIHHKVYCKKYNRCPLMSSIEDAEHLCSDTGLLLLINTSFIYNDCNIYIRVDKNVLEDFRLKFAQALIKGELNTFN